MDEFAADLRELDETQERVEAVSDGMLRAQSEGDAALAQEMVARWIAALRASDFQAERVAFLFVANHVLLKSLTAAAPVYLDLFAEHLSEAVALVSNSPMDRQNVTQLLELWHNKAIYPDEQILELWKCTGEELPPFLQAAASVASGATAADAAGADAAMAEGGDDPGAHLSHALPMKLDARSANPALDVLKKIDFHRAVVQHLDQQIGERHGEIVRQAETMYQTPEELLADRSTSARHVRQRVEECLRLVKVRNKFAREAAALKTALAAAIDRLVEDEEAAGSKIEQKLEQCDLIDIGLADLAEHRDRFPEEWSKAAYVCGERRKQREEEQRQREEEMARLHQAALAESAAHAMHLEADITASSSTELQSLSKELGSRAGEEQEAKPDDANEMVWHPVLRELVPLQSLNVEWESWRDH